ncbi:MAG: ATP-binding protein [Lachnospiraceae bacterium]|nr:ATP-binding protein [Lachnospiraceae bacterium]
MILFQEFPNEINDDVIRNLIAMSAQDAFSGNLWQVYLTLLLVNDENAFTLLAERTGICEGGIYQAALQDLNEFHIAFQKDIKAFPLIEHYEAIAHKPENYSTFIRDRIQELATALACAEDTETMLNTLCAFYKNYGVGTLGLHKAFRIEGGYEKKERVRIAPVRNIRHVSLDDLVGYEIAKEELLRNTQAFVEGRKANNCLLYGDVGTGKSTSIKAIANQFYQDGLRIIEVYKHQFRDIHDVIGEIKNRNYKFILYMDDLSFEDFETEYKYLKAVIEGGLEKRPENVLIYATSNRRHLVKEKFSDKASLDEDDIRHSDTVQEKLSLAHRFGVAIYFGPPTRKDFNQIVTTLADRNGITLPKEELIAEATKWEIAHGGLSGRCAQQFIDYLKGEEGT